jgi:hypothetical protein
MVSIGWLESCNWETYLESNRITISIIDATREEGTSLPHEEDADRPTVLRLKVPTYSYSCLVGESGGEISQGRCIYALSFSPSAMNLLL